MVKYMLKRSQEFVIGGYTAGNPFYALIVGCYEGAKLKFGEKWLCPPHAMRVISTVAGTPD